MADPNDVGSFGWFDATPDNVGAFGWTIFGDDGEIIAVGPAAAVSFGPVIEMPRVERFDDDDALIMALLGLELV